MAASAVVRYLEEFADNRSLSDDKDHLRKLDRKVAWLDQRIRQSTTAWGKARQRAGIQDFRFHDLRHTWASWHVQSGSSLPGLMELGGWKSYEMVLRYAHLAPEKLSFAAGRIERQASKLVEQAPRSAKAARNATFSPRSTN
jgi:integrase